MGYSDLLCREVFTHAAHKPGQLLIWVGLSRPGPVVCLVLGGSFLILGWVLNALTTFEHLMDLLESSGHGRRIYRVVYLNGTSQDTGNTWCDRAPHAYCILEKELQDGLV